MTLLKPFLVIVKTLLFYIFDSLALFNHTTAQNNKFDLVLIVRQDAIGDFILWLNTAKEYREIYPPNKYKIILIGNASWSVLADKFPYWDQVFPIYSKKFKSLTGYRWGLLRKIKTMSATIAIQPTYSREFYHGDTIIRASNALKKIGSAGDMSNRNWLKKLISDFWYTELIPASAKKMTELERNSEFFQGFSKKPHQFSYPMIPSKGLASTKEWEKLHYYVLFPGVSSFLRQWPMENFAEIATRIYYESGLTGILDGGPNEKLFAESIQGLTDAPLEWVGTKLSELPVLLKHSQFVISSETSAVHIAAAVNTNVICILGGAYYGRFLPYPELPEKQIYLETVSYSMPCYDCNGECIYPLKKNEAAPCITNISVDAVWEKVKSLLQN